MKRNLVSAIVILNFLLANVNAQESGWQIAKEKDGIAIYTRELAGAEVKEFKALTEINTEMEFLVDMVLDVKEYARWMDNIESAEVIKKLTNNEFYVYSLIDIPWPINDRDLVTLNQVEREGKAKVKISLQSVEGFVPVKDDVIRMPKANGFWEFTLVGNGKIGVVYQFLGDPGGSVPDWLVNMFLVDGPFKSLSNMRKIAESR